MSDPDRRSAFYAARPGGWRDWWTILHPPYTAWHLAYVAIGASLAPHLDGVRLGATVLAFFLAMGIGAHALDELHDRPLRTQISDAALVAATVGGLVVAVGLGVAGLSRVGWVLVPFVVVGPILVLGYNLELLGGALHNDMWFAVGWGAFPAFTGYFVEAEKVGLPGLLAAGGCLALSVAQRRLSSPARELRRRTGWVSGVRERSDGSTEALSRAGLLAPLDGALAALSLGIVVTACALVAARL